MSDYDGDILLWSERQGELLRRRATGALPSLRDPPSWRAEASSHPCGSGLIDLASRYGDGRPAAVAGS